MLLQKLSSGLLIIIQIYIKVSIKNTLISLKNNITAINDEPTQLPPKYWKTPLATTTTSSLSLLAVFCILACNIVIFLLA